MGYGDDYLEEGEFEGEPDFQSASGNRGSRFGDGQVPNRSGRPKGSPNRKTITKRVASKRHRVSIDGTVRRKNTLDLVLRAIRTGASRGSMAAFDLQEELKRRFGARVENVPQGVFITGEELTTDEWLAIYGSETSEEDCRRDYPHLLRQHLKWQVHQENTRRLEEQAKSTDYGRRALGSC